MSGVRTGGGCTLGKGEWAVRRGGPKIILPKIFSPKIFPKKYFLQKNSERNIFEKKSFCQKYVRKNIFAKNISKKIYSPKKF